MTTDSIMKNLEESSKKFSYQDLETMSRLLRQEYDENEKRYKEDNYFGHFIFIFTFWFFLLLTAVVFKVLQ